MTATNHALTGTAIGLITGRPWLALPLALASHYICDAIPHWRMGTSEAVPDEVLHKTLRFRNYLIVEALICFLIVLGLFFLKPENWLLASVCAFVAAAPDLISLRRYINNRFTAKKYQRSLYEKFADGIQWFERPSGAIVELAWLVSLIIIIAPFIW